MNSLPTAGSKFSAAATAVAALASSLLLLTAWASPRVAGRPGALVRLTAGRRLGLPLDTPRPASAADTGRYRPSRRPRVRAHDRPGNPFGPQRRRSPLVLPLPPNVKLTVTPDGDSAKTYDVQEKVGGEVDFRDPSRISQQELLRFQERQAIADYYRLKSRGGVTGAPAQPGTPQAQRLIPKIYLGPIADRIFGGSYVDIRPAGAVTIRAGARFNRNENPALTLRQQSVGDFIFEQNMNLNLTGQIGTKLKLVFNYDTKASFDFDNQMKFDYAGQETDILRKLDLGNVSMPLNNSLVTGGSNLFGIKTQLQFGRLGVTAVAATLRGSADEVRVQNGAQSRQFELKASQYERDRHYFLSQFFRDRYDQALRGLPTLQSGVEIRRLEVYVTNDNRTTDNLRNVVALQDLAEPRQARVYRTRFVVPGATERTPAKNQANTLYASLPGTKDAARADQSIDGLLANTLGLVRNVDYERVRARKLDPREYTFNAQLGYLNLNTALLPDQVLAVSYEYIFNGQRYQVGELQDDYAAVGQDQVIFLKMLRATNPGVGLADPTVNPGNRNLRTRNLPTWDLQMKNIYPLNASQLNRDNFQLQIIYKDDVTGVDLISLKEGSRIVNRPLIEVLGLDRVNPNNDRNPDGNFDYFPGITIDPELGKIIFPSVQPFGSFLQAQFDSVADAALIPKYVYSELYNQVQSDAQQVQEKDKFFLRGRFQATATDEINLPGIGIAQGSVRVRSGSTLLTEGVDYQVFYDQSKVKILNPAYLNSANELRVEFEKNALVQVQPRRLLGARFDYALNRDVNLGATVMHLLENQAPGINRVNIGDEPGNNTIVGLDAALRKESRVLTKLVDALPIVSTKEISTVAFSGEFAKLLAGRSQLGRGENGVSYVDDFENARTPYALGGLASIPLWRLAATPAPIATPAIGPGADTLAVNYKRARLAWYTVDQSYYTNGPNVPANIGAADLENHYTRGVPRSEIFPNRDLGATGNGFEFTFDMAYFPNERGPYNYNPNISPDGRLLNPGQPNLNRGNYGGISRGITFDTDFDNANVEYLEFWMLDPFLPGAKGQINDSQNPPVNSDTNPGGDFYLNLGNVSEDALADQNNYEFENGLPTPADQDPGTLVRRSAWGRVSRQQFLTDAFNAAPGARASQDVGLDGYGSADEQQFFARIPGYAGLADPSADDFRHHLDPFYDQNNVGILGRYKNYNGYEGNSPENSQLSSTAFPDKEDLNRDNVVQNVERYYEYKMSLRPAGQAGGLAVGSNYIIDKIVSPAPGGGRDTVTWYQFRIPIREYTGIVGSPTEFGFKNIRFVRLYLTGWSQPVVLRLVQPQFVANQWRRYLRSIADVGNQGGTPITDADAFSVSTVSLEENGAASANPAPGAIVYVQPPNIQRDREYGSSGTSRQQNEQSLRLCVDNLRAGYAKAAYKNISINMLRYKRLRMYLHGDSPDNSTKTGEVRAFIRIGTDYTQNYYEYSLPLAITPSGTVDQLGVWPPENNVDVAFQDFIDTKAARNQNAPGSYLIPYTRLLDPNNPNGARITVVGNPDFSAVQGCMIGILNPTANGTGAANYKTLCLWADEFRVFDFEQQDGFAATARMNVKLADLANITATGSFTSVGFGGLQDKVQQRSLDDVFRGDLNATVAVEKFLPDKARLRVPVLLQLGHESRSPQYDPLDPDTKLDQSLQKFRDRPDDAAEYRRKVIDQTTSKSISVLNVRKERSPTQTVQHPWDVENVALSYSLTERLHTDIRTDRDYTRSYTAALAYVYQSTPKNFAPLGKVKALDNPYLKVFQQLNFTPLPSRFSFRTDIDRRYNERFLQRVLEPGTLPTTDGIAPVIYKSFFINRLYDLKWDLTKSLIFDYTANNRGVIDEGPGRTIGNDPTAVANRQQLRDNLLRGGRTTNFNQTAALTYRLPLDKFPLTDWLSADTRYSANYTWQAASTALRGPDRATGVDTTLVLGNTIQNNAEFTANGKIDLVKLYNKVKFLNIINNAPPPAARRPAGLNLQQAAQPGAETAATRPKPEPRDTAKKDPLRFVKAVLRAVMTARSINFTYTRSNGTLVPGYLPKTHLFGFDRGFDAPGLPFILGKQYDIFDADPDNPNALYPRLARNGWYTPNSEFLNTPFSSLFTETLNLRTALEPFRSFNIQVDARRQLTRNREAFFRNQIDTTATYFRALTDANGNTQLARVQALGTGSFNTSTITIQTFFSDLGANGETSQAFNRFVENRRIVRDRLAAANLNGGTYSYNSQDVLIQSFLDAYHGRSSDGYEAQGFRPFDKLPLPNWRVDYNGFADLPLVRRYFRSFTLNHAYSSTYSIGSYTTSSVYSTEPGADVNYFPSLVNATGQYVPYYVVSQVSIVERLAPLVGVNFQTVSQVTGRVEYSTDRALTLNTTNAQVTELHSTQLVVGLGYSAAGFKLPFRVGGEQRTLKNTLTARLDLAIRDNTTIQRSIVDVADSTNNPGRPTSQITNGQLQYQLRPTVDYLLNTRLNLQFYFSQTISTPRVSNAFRNSTTEGGIQLRYSLTQ